MAKVASREPMIQSSKPLMFSGSIDGGLSGGSSTGSNGIKRKTPSELRGEQLKRKNVIEIMDESSAPELGSMLNPSGVKSEAMKPILLKNPRYIDTRVDELFPSRKNSLRLKMLSGKENVKDNITADHTDGLKNSSVSIKSAADMQPECSGLKDTHAPTSTTSTKCSKSTQYNITNKTCSTNMFRSIMELSTGADKSTGFSLDMDETFKELAAPIVSVSNNESLDRNATPTSANFCSEFHLPGQKIPLDFTLKTSMRVTTSSTVKWFHKLMSCGTVNGLEQFTSQDGCHMDQKMNCLTAPNSNTKAIYSWVYPQCSLPAPVISALNLSVKGEGQMDFLSKRQLAWETAFRSLYVMLRKKICNIFYVCTRQFVAMFTSSNGSTESKSMCSAYVSQSTRSLRSLLKEQDISFTMPLCLSKVEQVTTEDLFELSEIEKHNLGTAMRTVSVSDVDNSPESLLMFDDNNNVHGLYDFLLNYRFLLPSLSSFDVPSLYSPVPFENAAVSAPEIKCKEVRKINQISSETSQSLTPASYYTIEIKDAYLPPWIISGVCDTIKSNGDSFDANFTIEPMSIGLNIGVDTVGEKQDPKGMTVDEDGCPFGVVLHHLSRGFLKGLKYSDKSCTASLSPVFM